MQVNMTKETGRDNGIPGVSLLNNFSFEETGISTWRAYNVGWGALLDMVNLSFEKHGDTDLKVIQPFSPRTKEQGTLLESARPSSEIFSCSESGCVLTFKTEAEADAHMDSGKHVRELKSESLYDSIRKKWAKKVTGMNVPYHDHDSGPVHYNQPPSSLSINRQSIGWTLKTTKKSSRMEDHVKKTI